jgi:ABC-2 type transport system permease protein
LWNSASIWAEGRSRHPQIEGEEAPKYPKDVGQATYVTLIPLMVGYLVGLLASATEAAQGLRPTVLSLFPLTAPVVMVMRLAAGAVPAWQLLLSIGLMVAAAYLILRAVAAMFRAQYLLSGQPFSIRRFFAALFSPSS